MIFPEWDTQLWVIESNLWPREHLETETEGPDNYSSTSFVMLSLLLSNNQNWDNRNWHGPRNSHPCLKYLQISALNATNSTRPFCMLEVDQVLFHSDHMKHAIRIPNAQGHSKQCDRTTERKAMGIPEKTNVREKRPNPTRKKQTNGAKKKRARNDEEAEESNVQARRTCSKIKRWS